MRAESCPPLCGPHLFFSCMVSLLPSLSTPGILTCSIAPHCGHCPFKPPPILHQQKLHSPIKVDLKCSLFHEVLPDPPIHRDSASFGHLWGFAYIYLVTLVTHCDSQFGYVCVCLSHPSLWSRRSSRTLTSSFLCPFPVP